MRTILVTGSNGQLGKCLQDVAKDANDIQWIFKTSSDLDITNKKDIEALFKTEIIDYLVNCAAYTVVDKAEIEKEKAFLVNAEGVKYLAQACKITDTIFIHISTDFVFDGKKKLPYTEEDIPNPINVYGASKLKGEDYIKSILDNYFIIRTSWVYSEYGNNFVKTMLRLAKERDEIKVVNDQIGSPTYAGDLANFIIYLIKNNINKYGIYNYSNEGEISWYEFAKEIFGLSDKNINIIPISSKEYKNLAERPNFSILDINKIKQFRIVNHSWRESLQRCIKN